MSRALLLMGHGSRDPEGALEFLGLASAVGRRIGVPVEAGVLEFAGPVAPSIQEAADRCVLGGATEVVAQPVLLAPGNHHVQDMPAQVASAARRHPPVRFALGRCLGVDDRLIGAAADRVAGACAGPSGGGAASAAGAPAAAGAASAVGAASAGAPAGAPRRGTAVLLCGRGSLRHEANADLAEAARRMADVLRDRLPGVEAVRRCFISLARPSLPEGLRRCASLGVARILVVPYFLNTGVLVRRIAAQAAAEAEARPGGVTVEVTPHLGVDPRVVDVILDRSAEAALALEASGPQRRRLLAPGVARAASAAATPALATPVLATPVPATPVLATPVPVTPAPPPPGPLPAPGL